MAKRMSIQQLMNECAMIEGNVNRMMVTDNKEELYEMYYHASVRLGNILLENRKRLEADLMKNKRKMLEYVDSDMQALDFLSHVKQMKGQ